MTKWAFAVAGLLAVASLGGCQKAADALNPPQLYVDKAYVKLAATPNGPAALYFTVHGGDKDTRLLQILIPSALRYEMHRSMAGADGMAGMERLEYADIPAGKDVQFKPGGMHVMVWGIRPAVVDANAMPVTYVFQNGDRIEFSAEFVNPDGSHVVAKTATAAKASGSPTEPATGQ